MFNRLFKSAPEPKDGLIQSQREAIVDLLHYCMFADHLVALSESKFVAANVEAMSWDPKISFDYYQGKSIGAARAALDEPESRKGFFDSINLRLTTPELRNRAVGLCEKLFLADGTRSEKESAMLGAIRKALHIAQ
jgi:uncharacterized tellurite resistance protein B-like protein